MSTPSLLEQQMRKGEWFHKLQVPDGMWIILRLDGRSFTKLTSRMNHPFDDNFRDWMIETALHVFKDLDCVYGETHSDEISLVLQPGTDLFDREVEKLVSVSASLAGSFFTFRAQRPVSFDSRIVMFPTALDVASYFNWRQMDCHRGCVNSWLYWSLRKDGHTGAQAHRVTEGLSTDKKNAFLMEKFGINYTTDVPDWQKRGTGFYSLSFKREGWNPVKEQSEEALRRDVYTDKHLPYALDYFSWLEKNLIGLGPEDKWCFTKE